MLTNPAYAFRPSQVVRRVRRPQSGETAVRLPWGDLVEVSANEAIGSVLTRTGVHELATTEVIWRLAESTDLTLDVGANIGYFTSLLACRAGAVRAFEPHPDIGATLERNAATWGHENVTVDRRAVSHHKGTAHLAVPGAFLTNRGTSTLLQTPHEIAGFEIETVTLDSLVDEPVGVAKLDVEGYEPEVLAGAANVLSAGMIRDIVLEAHDGADGRAANQLRKYGYTLFGIAEVFWGAELVNPHSSRAIPRWDAPNYLATLEPERAASKMARRGWQSLRGR